MSRTAPMATVALAAVEMHARPDDDRDIHAR
jgi:hypothetical protein